MNNILYLHVHRFIIYFHWLSSPVRNSQNLPIES
nr:MAG TPA: hypothetical protein [Caudoviricetes sp.]